MSSAQKVIDQDLAQFGWLETVATNSITDFKSPNSTVVGKTTYKKYSDLIDLFICHLIFYVIFCYSLVLYLVIDLGFGAFIVKKCNSLIKIDPMEGISSIGSILINTN